jgi:uncharacterized protein YjbI with pentapeptide repeats
MALEERLRKISIKLKQNPLTSATILIVVLLLLLIVVPYLDVNHRGINNATVEATLENQSRATLAQILGGAAIGIGLYYTWRRITISEEDLKATQENLKVAQESLKVTQENLQVTQKVAQDNLKVAQEGQITERFTRAIDQLGNEKMDIRLGGIYALERISNESKEDYWPIMEILTAYVRNNSSIEAVVTNKGMSISMDIQANESTKKEDREKRKTASDIQAVLTVIGRRDNLFNSRNSLNHPNLQRHYRGASLMETHFRKDDFNEEYFVKSLIRLDLQRTYLREAFLTGAHFEGADFKEANLVNASLFKAHFEEALFVWAHLEEANLECAHLEEANLSWAHLERADFAGAHLERAILLKANLEGAYLNEANLQGATLFNAHLEGVDLREANLEGADLNRANFKGADLTGANLTGAELGRANLKGAEGLSLDQLSRVKTLYKAKLDHELLIPLEEMRPDLFEEYAYS